VVERKNLTLMNAIRSMLHDSHLSKPYWGEAILTVNYLQNRLPTLALAQHLTPFELWYGFKPNITHLRVFGCKAFAYIDKDIRKKLDSTIKECRFLGYNDSSKAYKLESIEDKRVIIARDVKFIETEKPSQSTPTTSAKEQYLTNAELQSDTTFFQQILTSQAINPRLEGGHATHINPTPPYIPPLNPLQIQEPILQALPVEQPQVNLSPIQPSTLSLYDFPTLTNSNQEEANFQPSTSPIQPRRSTRTPKSNPRYMSPTIDLSLRQKSKKRAMVAQVPIILEPKTYFEALNSKDAPH
jgi:hypothetical protein